MRRWLATACLLWPVVAFGGFQHLQGKGGGSTLMLHYPLTSGTSVVVLRGPTATVTSTSPPDCLSDGAWESMTTGQLCTDGTKGGRFNDDATNKLLYSEDFSQANWTKTNCTVTGSQTDPRGGTAAQKLTETAVDGKACQTISATASATYTLAVALKAASAVTARISLAGDVTAESIGTCSVTTSWPYTETSRCYHSLTLGGTDTTITACVYPGDGVTSSQAVTAFGAALTQNAVPHWYCPTTAASATCTATYATVDQGEGVAWQVAAGTIEATVTHDFDPTGVTYSTYATAWSIDDGTSNNFMLIRTEFVDVLRAYAYEYAGAVKQYSYYAGPTNTVPYSTTIRHAWDNSGVETWVDGVSGGTAPNNDLSTGTRTMTVGLESFNNIHLDGWLKDFKVWRRRVSP